MWSVIINENFLYLAIFNTLGLSCSLCFVGSESFLHPRITWNLVTEVIILLSRWQWKMSKVHITSNLLDIMRAVPNLDSLSPGFPLS